jgi:hypothetical protein
MNSKGEEIPSVTQIISILTKKGITEWANSLGFRRVSVKKFLDNKALIGTLVHSRIENYFKKEEYKPFIDKSTDDIVNARYELFKIWVNEAKPEMIWQEKEFTNERYGGKLDMLCKMYDDKYVLLDFKTSKDIHPSQFLQLGGYLNLIEYNESEMYEKISLCQIVAFGEKGIKQRVFTKEEMKRYQKAFEKCYEIYMCWDNILQDMWDENLKNLK